MKRKINRLEKELELQEQDHNEEMRLQQKKIRALKRKNEAFKEKIEELEKKISKKDTRKRPKKEM